MQIFGINLNSKAELKNIKSLLKVGEIIEVKVVSKKGKDVYLLQIKGNLFEGLSTEEIAKENLNAIVETTEPNIVLKSEDDSSLTIRLKAFLKKSTQTNYIKQNGIVIKADKTTQKANILFQKGDIIEAVVISKKSPKTYILRIDKAVFEAIANLEEPMKGDKLTLLVEKIKPQIVLKIIGKNREQIEYIKGDNSVVVNNEKAKSDIILNALKNVIEAIELNSKKEALINTQKALNSIDSVKISIKNLKNFIEAVKNSIELTAQTRVDTKTIEKELQNNINTIKNSGFKDRSDFNQDLKRVILDKRRLQNSTSRNLTEEKISNVLKNIKVNTPLNRIIENLLEIVDGKVTKDLKIDTSEIKSLIRKIEPFLNMSILANNQINNIQQTQTSILSGFLKELSDGLDKIFNSINVAENSLKEVEKALIVSKMQNAKDLTAKTLEFIENNIIKKEGNNEQKIDTQKMFESIKNIIQQIKIPANSSNIFVQIPVFIDNKKSELFINKKQSKDEKNGKKSFKMRIVANSSAFGYVQIDGLYIDGKISCNIGFERQANLNKFNESVEKLQKILSKNVSISAFLLKSKPAIIPKKLNIKA